MNDDLHERRRRKEFDDDLFPDGACVLCCEPKSEHERTALGWKHPGAEHETRMVRQFCTCEGPFGCEIHDGGEDVV